jgi:hypothetical protein
MTERGLRLIATAFVIAAGSLMALNTDVRSLGSFMVVIRALLFLRDWFSGHLAERSEKLKPTGLCRKCGYSLTGNISGVCPECGEKVGMC